MIFKIYHMHNYQVIQMNSIKCYLENINIKNQQWNLKLQNLNVSFNDVLTLSLSYLYFYHFLEFLKIISSYSYQFRINVSTEICVK